MASIAALYRCSRGDDRTAIRRGGGRRRQRLPDRETVDPPCRRANSRIDNPSTRGTAANVGEQLHT